VDWPILSMRLIALVVLVAAAPSAEADLQIPVLRTRPLILHLEGTMTADRAAAARAGFTAVSFAVVGRDPAERFWLGVDQVYPLGDYPRLGKDILDDVHMYDPTYFVVGPPDLVTRFTSIAPASRVVLEGLANGSGRTFYLRMVAGDEGR
jgi:hypothetical protein